MPSYIEVMAIVEGKTEQIFVEKILGPYLAEKKIYIHATQVTKPGQNGGDVHFQRVQRDLGNHLKQRADIYVTTFVDYYGTKHWPGMNAVQPNASPDQIARCLNDATQAKVSELFPAQQSERRFIPYIAVHEFETLLFSNPTILAKSLEADETEIQSVIAGCGEAEAINNGPQSAPSKRLDSWSSEGKFAKTITGIRVAKEIGIPKMREKCPVFNQWLEKFEAIVGEDE